MIKKRYLFSLLFLCGMTFLPAHWVLGTARQLADAPLVIRVTEYGLHPDTRENMTPRFAKLVEKYGEDGRTVKFVFPSGRYDFWPNHSVEKIYFESNTKDNNPKSCAIFLYGKKNITIEGGGSRFIFHGKMQPFTIDSCENIRLSNLSIDWDVPLTAQGRIIATRPDFIDVAVDPHAYPFVIEDGKIFFTGEGWKSHWFGVMELDSATGNVVPGSGDQCLGKGWNGYKAERIAEGTIRLHYPFLRKPEVGNCLIFRHSDRDHAGVFILHSRNVHLDRINMYYAAGLGILAQYSSDVSLEAVAVVPNKAKGRYFSGHDDGFQVSNCQGQITVDSCVFEGLMDDPINVHGTAVRVIAKAGDNRLICRFMHPASKGFRWAVPGDRVGLINHRNMHTRTTARVTAFEPISVDTFSITFAEALPTSLQLGDALENLSWTPDVTIRHSVFGGTNRARGLLVTTPGKVLIENNTFSSSGAAILIAGDANFWYESGAVKDVVIRKNTFTSECMTSLYQFCEGIISIVPNIPELKTGSPAFHRNIRISENTFHPFDYPILYAKSVDGLLFSDNVLIRSRDYAPYHSTKAGITLDGCYHVRIAKNTLTGGILGTRVVTEHMQAGALDLAADSGFQLEQ